MYFSNVYIYIHIYHYIYIYMYVIIQYTLIYIWHYKYTYEFHESNMGNDLFLDLPHGMSRFRDDQEVGTES